MGKFRKHSLYVMGILGFLMISYMFITVITLQVEINRWSDSLSVDTPEPDITLDMQTPDAPRNDCIPPVGQEDQPCP